MRILLVNDDGIACQGILALVRALKHEHQLTVIAPASERSGFSHSLSIHNTISVTKTTIPGHEDVEAYAISGTPADCTKLGVRTLCKERPDLVISGINFGNNLGTDTSYSGTCAGALEAALLGLPGIAVSQHHKEGEEDRVEFDTGARFIAGILGDIAKWDWPEGCILNVNIPDLWNSKVEGVAVCPLSGLHYEESYDLVEQTGENVFVYK
ncbi:MAG: 5'/3'-nucleotidase SurE, partial [Christensenellaceae bacterium]|nr:5'/3'-nucleotidase SurE [Christensenellaceae bacterium]